MRKILSIFFGCIDGHCGCFFRKGRSLSVTPMVSGFLLYPLAPDAGQNIVVRATVVDINGVGTVKLFYKINDGAFVTVNMTKVGTTNVHTGRIPGQTAGTTVNYCIEVENIINKKTYSPASATATPATFTIGGSVVFHYWHLNELPPRVETPATVQSDFTFSGVGSASMLYNGAHLDPISQGTGIKAHMGAPAGAGLRVISAYGDLIIAAPSTGFKDLELSFAYSGLGGGANTTELQYSVNGGSSRITIQTISGFPGEPDWTGYDIDLKSIPALNNNGNLVFKVIPSGSLLETSGLTTFSFRKENLIV